jgi:hypothetical protein
MAHFEKTPDGYSITHAGHTLTLSTDEAYELLAWLDQYRDELFQTLHPAVKEMPSRVTPDTLQAWQRARATVEAYKHEHPFGSTEREENNKEYRDEDL